MGKGKSGKPVQAKCLEPEFNLHPRSVVFSLPKLLAYLSVGLLNCSDSQTKVECLGWLQKDESPDDTPDCIARRGHVPFETFCFCLNRYTMKRKQSPSEEKRDAISPHQWEEKWKGGKNLFSSSALNHCRLWNSRGAGGGGWSCVDSLVRKGPSEVLLTQMSSRCLMCLWQPWPISAQWWKVAVIKNLRTNVIASRCFPVVCGGWGWGWAFRVLTSCKRKCAPILQD